MRIGANRFNHNFILVIIAQITSLFGSAMLHFALNLYVLDITGRADIFAAVLAVTTIPRIVFAPIGGAIADRFNKRNLMVIFDFSSSVIVILMIFLISRGNTSVFAIGAVLVILAIIASMYQPAVQASIPALVSEVHLAGANGIVNGVGALSGLLGPVMGGMLYGIIGLRTIVIITCAVFFLSAVMEIFIHIPFVKRTSDKHIVITILNDLKDGFHYIAKDNTLILKICFLAAIMNFSFTPLFTIGIPFILRVVMKSNDTMYGIGLGLLEFSTILGALLTGVFAKKIKMPNMYLVFVFIALLLLPMAVAVTPAFVSLGYWLSFVLFFLFTIIVVALTTMVSVYIITEVQKITPNDMLGKVMAIIMTIAQLLMPFGQMLYGFLFQAADTYFPILLTAVFTFFIALCAIGGKYHAKRGVV